MTDPSQSISPRKRIVISGFVIVHLLAVALPPLSFQTRGPLGPSPSVATLFAWFERYSQWMYLDRGYAFFAPNPGPSHLVQAAITQSGGEPTEIMFPDRSKQWPRLLYHRHFMLTEFLEEIYQPPGPPPELLELDPAEAEYWVGARARYEHVRQSYIDHLRAEYPGREVAIRRIEHLIPDVLEFQRRPIELTDASLYRVMLDVPIAWNAGPQGSVETIPPPTEALVPSSAGTGDPTAIQSPPSILPPAIDRSDAGTVDTDGSSQTPGAGES
jgi:hypothetical protein